MNRARRRGDVPIDSMDRSDTSYSVTFEDRIRVRAYEIYVEGGGHDGFADRDWLQAEAEVRAVKTFAAAATAAWQFLEAQFCGPLLLWAH